MRVVKSSSLEKQDNVFFVLRFKGGIGGKGEGGEGGDEEGRGEKNKRKLFCVVILLRVLTQTAT